MKFSKQTGCFYPDDIQYTDLPPDLLEVTEAEFASALNRKMDETLDVVEGKLVILPVPAVSDEQKLHTFKQQALARVESMYAKFIQKTVGHATQTEKDTWAFKRDLACAILQGAPLNALEESFLEQAKLTTKDLKTSWAQAVLNNATRYAQMVGLAENMRKTCRQAIADATDTALLEEVMQAQSDVTEKAAEQLLEQIAQGQQNPLQTQSESGGFFHRLLFGKSPASL